jgi:Protein of unknown function (DUF1449)
MHPIDLLQWWNLIFDLPFVAALIPLLLQATGAAHFGHSGHGVPIGHAGGLHGHHIHLSHPHLPHVGHHHIESGGGHAAPAAAAQPASHAAPAHHAPSPGPIARALGLLGIGKAPIMLVFSSFSFTWGFTGLVANQLLARALPLPEVFIYFSMTIAFASSVLLTSVVSQGVSRVMPAVETYTTTKDEFVGKTGHALYAVDGKSGAAVVLDNESNRVQIKCHTEEGASALSKGQPLCISRYDEQRDMFVVEALALSDGERAQLAEVEKKLKLKN